MKKIKPTAVNKQLAREATRALNLGNRKAKKATNKIDNLEKKQPVGAISQTIKVKKNGVTKIKNKGLEMQKKLADQKVNLDKAKKIIEIRAAEGRRTDGHIGAPKTPSGMYGIKQTGREKNETRAEQKVRYKGLNDQQRAKNKAKRQAGRK